MVNEIRKAVGIIRGLFEIINYYEDCLIKIDPCFISTRLDAELLVKITKSMKDAREWISSINGYLGSIYDFSVNEITEPAITKLPNDKE